MTLDQLQRKKPATIIGFNSSHPELEIRLREIGFAEGDSVETLHVGLFNKNPISVRLNGAIIALRRQDASAIKIDFLDPSSNDILSDETN